MTLHHRIGLGLVISQVIHSTDLTHKLDLTHLMEATVRTTTLTHFLSDSSLIMDHLIHLQIGRIVVIVVATHLVVVIDLALTIHSHLITTTKALIQIQIHFLRNRLPHQADQTHSNPTQLNLAVIHLTLVRVDLVPMYLVIVRVVHPIIIHSLRSKLQAQMCLLPTRQVMSLPMGNRSRA